MRTQNEAQTFIDRVFVAGFLFGFGTCGAAMAILLALMFHSWAPFLAGQVFAVPLLLALRIGRER